MDNFIYGIVSSSFFTFVILFGIFVYLTRWALSDQKAYRGYGLGWLVALFVMVIISSLTAQPPEEAQQSVDIEETRVTLNLFQIMFSVFLGFMIAGSSMIFSLGNRSTQLGRSLRVAAYTSLIILVMFLFFVVGDVAQRMISLFTLAFGIGLLFLQIVRRQLIAQQSRHMPDDSDDDLTKERVDGAAPANQSRGGAAQNQNRVSRIRERMRQRR